MTFNDNIKNDVSAVITWFQKSIQIFFQKTSAHSLMMLFDNQ